jgi:hypothetical protein
MGCGAPTLPRAAAPPVAWPLGDAGRRAEESTFLTYPEWFIVYSSQEYARWLASERPSRFPYVRSIAQYWCGYDAVYRLTESRYPFNTGDHLMLVVIGASYTAEYALKGAYEATVGATFEAIGGYDSDEDRYARGVAADYATFLNHTPWYNYPFFERLAALWREVPLMGPSPLRKLERRAVLSADLGAKAVYGWMIGAGSGAAYAPEESATDVLVDLPPGGLPGKEQRARVVWQEGNRAVLRLPRYTEMADVLLPLMEVGVRPLAIAGNGQVMVTLLAPRGFRYDLPDGTMVFSQPILTDPALERVAVSVPVASLDRVLPALAERGARLEHVYDY